MFRKFLSKKRAGETFSQEFSRKLLERKKGLLKSYKTETAKVSFVRSEITSCGSAMVLDEFEAAFKSCRDAFVVASSLQSADSRQKHIADIFCYASNMHRAYVTKPDKSKKLSAKMALLTREVRTFARQNDVELPQAKDTGRHLLKRPRAA